MIANTSSIINDAFRCNRAIMEHLVKSGVPMLSYDEKYYYFANTELLKKTLKEMPLYLKVMDALSGKRR